MNLWQHLEENHVEEFYQAKEEARQTSESKSSSDKSTTQEAPHNQPTMNKVLSLTHKILQGLSDLVCCFISQDMKPIKQ